MTYLLDNPTPRLTEKSDFLKRLESQQEAMKVAEETRVAELRAKIAEERRQQNLRLFGWVESLPQKLTLIDETYGPTVRPSVVLQFRR